jgi:hypothetical protein
LFVILSGDLRALMLRMLLQLRYVKGLVRLLRKTHISGKFADTGIRCSLKLISAT